MAKVEDLIARIRSHGANVMIDSGKLKLVNARKLPEGAMEFIRRNGKAIAEYLDQEAAFEERAAIIEFDGGAPREWAEKFATFCIQQRPDGVDDIDWSWFISQCGKIIDEAPERRAA
ncbi:hypothetical protein JYP49_14205 [Nitratireductor aquimarinus]|uniref:hypothetical protein n=1 Tax=Nitratireductor TaxID=245876 RepID=UPI0019D3E2EE|nr:MULTISPECIES: hypothetical protein [Nitratireductor]MBN7777750.1 hypothetical protein [Nitratireductor pacificus]MBN7781744.1 hypothetical protein [Nitratireductor pacificus]MBN7790550.1 hypothetical protein [Nitratireductor aquimarinus]MBY6099960.1 hypothetical protein [Nitratireductor aquimarinus]MCA1260426.1 hypothetical protein [Nitratireductor aquimarinus]